MVACESHRAVRAAYPEVVDFVTMLWLSVDRSRAEALRLQRRHATYWGGPLAFDMQRAARIHDLPPADRQTALRAVRHCIREWRLLLRSPIGGERLVEERVLAVAHWLTHAHEDFPVVASLALAVMMRPSTYSVSSFFMGMPGRGRGDSLLIPPQQEWPQRGASNPEDAVIASLIEGYATRQGRPVSLALVTDLWLRHIDRRDRPALSPTQQLSVVLWERDAGYRALIQRCPAVVWQTAPDFWWNAAFRSPTKEERLWSIHARMSIHATTPEA